MSTLTNLLICGFSTIGNIRYHGNIATEDGYL